MIDFNSDYLMTIGGKSVATKSTCPVYNPATREAIANVPDCSESQLNAAVQAARTAFEQWRHTSKEERQKALHAIADVMEKNAEAFMALLTKEQGKPRADAEWEILGSVYWLREIAKQSLPDEVIHDTAERRVVTRFTPLGVVGGITPWNFPVLLAVWKIAPALAAGNTIVVKPSPFTPLTTLKLGELLRDVLPAGVLNVISGGDALGPLMSAHPGIDKLSFTGSTQTGRAVMSSAAVNLKRLTLELGGNDAAIVLPDADVEAIAPAIFWGAFANNAQYCLAIKRLYIHEDVYDRLAHALVRLAQETRVGPGDMEGVHLGPVQNRRQFERLKALLEDTRSAGYRILAGGEVADGSGYFFPVTLVDNPPDSARVVREEPFGPILPLLKFRDVDDAIARANDSEYGLGGSVWGRDAQAAMQVALRLNTGTVWVNQIHTLGPHKPMAGHKQSGVGIENGVEGLLEYTVPRTVSLKRSQ